MYTLIWWFTVKPARRAEFEAHYAANGAWAALFRKSAGYLGTVLLRDTACADVYVTLDHWTDRAAFEAFKAAHGAAYAELDHICEGLTEKEERLGAIAESRSP